MSIDFKFGEWPKRSERSTNRLPHQRQLLVSGIGRQRSFLDRDLERHLNPKDRSHWYRVKPDGTYALRLYVRNVATALNDDGETTIIADTRDEAKEIYEQLLEDVEAGKYDELIKKHLASIPPRKRKKQVSDND